MECSIETFKPIHESKNESEKGKWSTWGYLGSGVCLGAGISFEPRILIMPSQVAIRTGNIEEGTP
jgi:hypothetical protein